MEQQNFEVPNESSLLFKFNDQPTFLKKSSDVDDEIDEEQVLQTPRIKKDKNQKKQQINKILLINDLLLALNLKKSSKTLMKTVWQKMNISNPQLQLTTTKNDRVRLIVQSVQKSKKFTQMLQNCETILSAKSNEQLLHFRQQTGIEKVLQNIFSFKQIVKIPINLKININMHEQKIDLIAINDKQQICMIDKKLRIYVISPLGEHRNLQLQLNNPIIKLRWIDNHLIALITSANQLIIYSSNLKDKFSHSFGPNNIAIAQIEIHQLDHSKYLILLCQTQTNMVIQKILKILPNQIICINEQYLKSNYSFQKILMLKTNKLFESRIFVGWSDCQNYIVKLEFENAKEGIIFSSLNFINSRIDSIQVSKNKAHIYLLLHKTHRTQSNLFNSASCQYVLVEVNQCGQINRSININASNQRLLQSKMAIINLTIQKILLINEDRIFCFAYHNHIIYYSMESENILYIHTIPNVNNIHLVYANISTNSILYSSTKSINLISDQDVEKQQINISNSKSRQMEARDLQMRLRRIQGIPEGLLLLLRTLRQNQLQFIELP